MSASALTARANSAATRPSIRLAPMAMFSNATGTLERPATMVSETPACSVESSSAKDMREHRPRLLLQVSFFHFLGVSVG